QQSKLFSTQIPAIALQSMELVTGSPNAQYGDKTSLVVNATTRSALGVTKAFGNIDADWGSFGTGGGNIALGVGGRKYGNFIALSGIRSAHFLDTPATASQDRFLTNYGIKADISHTQGRHDIKLGTQIQQTRLDEKFQFGLTDPAYNAVCLDQNGDPLELPKVIDPDQCSKVNRTY